jgi:hypothetical protein
MKRSMENKNKIRRRMKRCNKKGGVRYHEEQSQATRAWRKRDPTHAEHTYLPVLSRDPVYPVDLVSHCAGLIDHTPGRLFSPIYGND